MLHLQRISLVHFKNYPDREYRFTERITGICGPNGAGKTNLLDAIHYLCFTRSYFGRQDSGHVHHGQSGFRIEGTLEQDEQTEKAVCVLRETGKKEFEVNGTAYEKFSAHLGRYPCVVIAPDDAELITGSAEERRKFMDSLLSQVDPQYLRNLIAYTRILQQRNSLLRNASISGNLDEHLLDVLDEQMTEPAKYIFEKRLDFTQAMLPLVQTFYEEIAGRKENIDCRYQSDLEKSSLAELLRLNRQKDRATQRTGAGIHRDDILFRLDGQTFRNIASQGQRKSLLFALKLTEFETLHREKGFPPLLLLDDVFEKLDEDRIGNLLRKVCVENHGQVFITDTHVERLVSHLEALSVGFEIVRL